MSEIGPSVASTLRIRPSHRFRVRAAFNQIPDEVATGGNARSASASNRSGHTGPETRWNAKQRTGERLFNASGPT